MSKPAGCTMTYRPGILFAAVAFSAFADRPQTPPATQRDTAQAQSAARQQNAARPSGPNHETARSASRQQQIQQAQTRLPVPACSAGSQCLEERKEQARKQMYRDAEEQRVREEARRAAGPGGNLCAADACESCDGVCLRPTARSSCVCSHEK